MKTREIVTLLLGLAVVAGFVVTVKSKDSRTATDSPGMTSEAGTEGSTTRQSQNSETAKLTKDDPATTERRLAQYTFKKGLSIGYDKDLPLSAKGLLNDLEFHAYAEVAPDHEDGELVPITVDYYDLKTGTIGIRSTANEIREPERGMFLLTRVPR